MAKGKAKPKENLTDHEEAQEFFREALLLLKKNNIPFLIGGAFALYEYTGIKRNTKDLDLFCKAGEYQKILKLFDSKGFTPEITDARWLAKIFHKEHFIDIIFNTVNSLCVVDETWFENSNTATVYGVEVQMMSPEEFLWSKIYVQNRERYDGADINHLILKQGQTMNWKRVLLRMEQHWELLLAQFLSFQFVYPADRDVVPKWLLYELLDRARDQYDLPAPKEKVCRGPLIDATHYSADITDWGYKVITILTI